MSRPEKWKPEYARIAEHAAKIGATDVEIAEMLEISVRTLHYWKKDHPELIESLKSGKAAADERVERSLYHKAVGYTYESEKVFQFQGAIVRTPTREHVPPDTTAMIFWLKNRRPDAWRDVQKHEVGRPGEFDDIDNSDELRARLIAEAKELGEGPLAAALSGKERGARGKPH